jgi:hypothetical protein
MQLAFGAGALWGNRTDVTGTGIGPDQFGILQDVQIDFDWTTKELWGQFQFPVDIARGQGKIAGKAKFARIFGAIYGDLFFGQSPAAGQYSVNLATGVYTFAAADANAAVAISYLYNVSSAGKKLVLTNQFMGYTPTFKATFYTTKTTQGAAAGLALVLNACTASKLSLPTKTDDYEIQEFDFSAFADATGTIGTLSAAE